MKQLDSSSPSTLTTWELSKLALGVGFGSIIEYYDFFIALLASSIVWPTVFFSWASTPSIAYGLSLASFGVLYFTRPIGASIFGHYGDKLGRRSLVLWTLAIMVFTILVAMAVSMLCLSRMRETRAERMAL